MYQKKKCLLCGKETRNKKYCSRSCSQTVNNRGVRRNGNPAKVCIVCGKEHRNPKVCSLSCSAKLLVNQRHEDIDLNGNEDQKHGVTSMKRYLVWKHNGTCQNCECGTWMGGKMSVEIHHVNGKSKDNRVSNLQLLCPNCHALTPTYKAKNRNCDRR